MAISLVFVVRTIRTSVAYRSSRYAAAVAAGEVVVVALWPLTPGLSAIRCKSDTRFIGTVIFFNNSQFAGEMEILEFRIFYKE